MELLRKGKVKEVYAAGEDELEFYFTNNISVFDKVIPSQIPLKGEVLCRCAAHWFDVAGEMGYVTHFVGMTGPDRMRVKRVDVIEDYSKLTPDSRNYLIPLEIVVRHYVAGSLLDRVKKGLEGPEDLGFPAGREVTYGMELPEPYFETTTKLEHTDRLLSWDEARDIAGLTPDEFAEIREMAFRLDEKMQKEVSKRGLIHVDGKKEFAFGPERELMIIDAFGTPDEDRFWDKQRYEESGECVELSKEVVRQHYRSTGYHRALYDAREKGLPEPEIPALPEEMVEKVSQLYVDLFQRITGKEF
jgi:phosphoribosylaminoimidazole-succinocarboxamide synthase